MLKKGEFIKEPPPQIGRHWCYALTRRHKTEEEHFAEALIRGNKIQTTSKIEQLVARLIGI